MLLKHFNKCEGLEIRSTLFLYLILLLCVWNLLLIYGNSASQDKSESVPCTASVLWLISELKVHLQTKRRALLLVVVSHRGRNRTEMQGIIAAICPFQNSQKKKKPQSNTDYWLSVSELRKSLFEVCRVKLWFINVAGFVACEL